MKFIDEFKEFALKGNVVDMAVGIIVGGAFGKITASLVGDVIMPPIGLLLGGVDFSDLAITLKSTTANSTAVTLNYGKFIQTCLDFFILAFAIFLMIKAINALRKRAEKATPAATPPAPSKQETLLAEIRDILKSK